MERSRGGAISHLPPEFIESIEISDDESTSMSTVACACGELLPLPGKKMKSARFLMNSEPNDPFLPTLTQKEKGNEISLTALEKRVGGFGTCPVVSCISHVPNERKPIHKRVRRVYHKNDKSKSLKHNSNNSFNDCDIGQIIVNINDEMSVIESSNVSISESNKVLLNYNDMDHNS
ncbi:hypothetical protein AVEN_138992-1 [Araneus ventricosus]|uniref:Uncharacterized protein n=1 Tax=Araneus ventricosus TaxID=182803 RepID=A0A4Y2SDA2_ARAVE|nr:hypothetical protein AVEN_138992-1 [Araneus ventricosus]